MGANPVFCKMTEKTASNTSKQKPLCEAARRALIEAEARRTMVDDKTKSLPVEKGGRKGLEPTRYNDWEVKGLTVDF
jgi:hypothetical protein